MCEFRIKSQKWTQYTRFIMSDMRQHDEYPTIRHHSSYMRFPWEIGRKTRQLSVVSNLYKIYDIFIEYIAGPELITG